VSKPSKSESDLAACEHKSFERIKFESVDELGVNYALYKHVATGAEVMSVETDDNNKVFGVTFRTPSPDSTGVAHIMEHSVLCGSRKYPVKDPFIQLRRTSLQTYLNAFTYPDRTVYPVASQNLKDFYNLANVYLDAVLHPRAIEDPMVLAQEGWHLELHNKSDPLIYKGIVFNEMKGANSAPEKRLHQQAMANLFPDTSYRFSSAGDPKEIPQLTFEKFKNFYQRYYHPSNARIYIYGNDPVGARLDLLDSYLSEFSKPKEPVEGTRIQTQKMWHKPRSAQAPYPVTAQQAAAKGGAKHMVTLYWVLNEEPMPYAEQLAMSVVTSLLLGSTTSPLYRALIKSGYGESLMGGGYSDSLKQATFSVGLKGIQKDDVAKVENLIKEKLSNITHEGFSKQAVEAAMNSLEFSIREFASGSSNRGLSIYLNAVSNWIYERDPVAGLKFNEPLQKIKAALAKDGQRFFEELIEKHLIKNTHRLTLEGVPDSTMVAHDLAAEKSALSKAKSAMSESEIAKVITETVELRTAQKSKDTEEHLKTLPKLSLADLDRKEKDLDITITEKHGVPVLVHEVPSSGIVYTQLALDLSVVPISYMPVLPLFMNLLFDVGTSRLSSTEFTQKQGAHTGGIGVSKLNALKLGKGGVVSDLNDIAFRLIVSGKSTADQANDLFELMLMGITDSKLDNRARALESLKSSKASMESSLRSSGSSFSSTRVLARRSLAGYFDEITGGITYYESLPGLLEMAENDWPKLLSQLKSLNEFLLQKHAIIINLSGDRQTLKTVDSAVDGFVQSLLKASATQPSKDTKGPLVADAMKGNPLLRLAEQDEGFVVPSPVNYVVKGGALFSPGESISGSTEVVVRLISQSYMWDKVRVLGGAYGGGCSLSHHSGTFSCYSYRDPNLKSTLEVFDAIASYIENLKLDDKEIEQLIIGAVGDLDKPMTAASKGYSSMVRWLLNNNLEVRQKRRDEMLATTASSFKEFVKRMRMSAMNWRSSIFGSKIAFAKANAALTEAKRIPLKKLQ
jgi:Zn-dependent M16 (insulinase) family peptidase